MQPASEKTFDTPVKKKSFRRGFTAAAMLLLLIALPILYLRLRKFPDQPAALRSAAQSVITLECFDGKGEPYCTGTAVALFREGIFVTNYHIIKDNVTKIVAHTASGNVFELNHVHAFDRAKDLAILSTEASTGITPLATGDGDGLTPGARVVAMGSPLGFSNAVAAGTFSGYYQTPELNEIRYYTELPYGSSGGALFNDRGEVIGITSGSYASAQQGNGAIPISCADELMNSEQESTPIADFPDKYREDPITVNYAANRGFSEPTQIYSTLLSSIVSDYTLQSCAYDSSRDRYGIAFISTKKEGLCKFFITKSLTDFSDAIVTSLDLGHANDMTYDPINDRFVVAAHISSSGKQAGHTPANALVCVSPTDGTIQERKLITGLSICSSVEYYDGEYIVYNEETGWFYRVGLDGDQVHRMFKSSNVAMNQYFGRENKGMYCQGIVIRDDVIYRLIAVKTGDRLDTVLLVGIDFSGDFVSKQTFHVNTLSEAEGIVFHGNTLYIVCSSAFYSVYRTYWDEPTSEKYRATEIPANSDLNACLADGTYYSGTKTNTATLKNLPKDDINAAFTLTVAQQGADSKRQWLVLNTSVSPVYTRFFNRLTGNWGPWVKYEGTIVK